MSEVGRGEEREPAPRFLSVALVLGPWGANGAVRVQVLTEFPDRFRERRLLYIDEKPYEVAEIFPHKGGMVVQFVGIDSRTLAGELRGKLLEIPTEEAQPLPADHFYWHQIVGLDVWTRQGRYLGTVNDILPLPSNDVYVVEDNRRELLIPAIKDVVQEIDLASHKIVIEPLPGLIPEDNPPP